MRYRQSEKLRREMQRFGHDHARREIEAARDDGCLDDNARRRLRYRLYREVDESSMAAYLKAATKDGIAKAFAERHAPLRRRGRKRNYGYLTEVSVVRRMDALVDGGVGPAKAADIIAAEEAAGRRWLIERIASGDPNFQRLLPAKAAPTASAIYKKWQARRRSNSSKSAF